MALAEPITIDTAEEQFPLRRYLITVDVYRKMGEQGLIPPEARVELLYDQKMTLKSGDTVSPLAFPTVSLDLKAILG